MNSPDLAAPELTKTAEFAEGFAAQLRGSLLDGSAPSYEEARKVWNGMIDCKPRFIVRCASAADAAAAVNFARDNGLAVAVRGGGHNIAGNAVCEGGLVIDFSQMRAVQVDAANKRARIEPGATLADVDRETQKFGLAIPVGINSTTGIAGLTLGGGFGWLSRKYGLTIDSLLSADVVTANGEQLRASPAENPDLFWALRGGGGNFGVVTSFEFALHEAGPEVLSGLVVHPFDAAEEVLKSYRQALKTAPDELSCWAVMRKAPPLPFLPPEWHGKEVLDSRYLLLRRYGCGGKGGGRAALHWNADCRCGWTAPLCELGAGLRPAARSRSAQLLEEPRFRRPFRCRNRNPRRCGQPGCPARNARSSLGIWAEPWAVSRRTLPPSRKEARITS